MPNRSGTAHPAQLILKPSRHTPSPQYFCAARRATPPGLRVALPSRLQVSLTKGVFRNTIYSFFSVVSCQFARSECFAPCKAMIVFECLLFHVSHRCPCRDSRLGDLLRPRRSNVSSLVCCCTPLHSKCSVPLRRVCRVRSSLFFEVRAAAPRLRQEQPNKRNRKLEKEVETLNNMTHFGSNVHKLADVPAPLLWPQPWQ